MNRKSVMLCINKFNEGGLILLAEEANEEPVVYHWKYKLDEIDPNEEVQVETLPLEKSS